MNIPRETRFSNPVNTENDVPMAVFLYEHGCPYCRRTYDYIVQPLTFWGYVTSELVNVERDRDRFSDWFDTLTQYYPDKMGTPIIRFVFGPTGKPFHWQPVSQQDIYTFGQAQTENVEEFRDRILDFLEEKGVEIVRDALPSIDSEEILASVGREDGFERGRKGRGV